MTIKLENYIIFKYELNTAIQQAKVIFKDILPQEIKNLQLRKKGRAYYVLYRSLQSFTQLKFKSLTFKDYSNIRSFINPVYELHKFLNIKNPSIF